MAVSVAYQSPRSTSDLGAQGLSASGPLRSASEAHCRSCETMTCSWRVDDSWTDLASLTPSYSRMSAMPFSFVTWATGVTNVRCYEDAAASR